MKSHSQRGVALVTTLIMLSLITFTAVVFLALTTRERNAVVVTQNESTSRSMSAAGLARAQAEVVGLMKGTTNKFNYDLLVSQTYPSTPAANYTSYTNFTNEASLATIANLQYDSRPPVYIATNTSGLPPDYRFFLDFNRNGQYEYTDPTNGLIGDPHWVGILEKPEYLHSGSNRFVGRFAYIVLPAGKSLDLNFMHNDSKRLDNTMTLQEGYLRNQGVGSWELNLAAFLTELHSNNWGYSYTTNMSFPSTFAGPGRDSSLDALSLLKYRYGGTYSNLDNVAHYFGSASYASTAFYLNNIDSYTFGPIQTGFGMLTSPNVNVTWPWPGAANTNSSAQSFYDIQQLFNTNGANSVYSGFSASLLGLMTPTSAFNYDRYTFYRLLAQLGTDSVAPTPPPSGPININYDNVNYPATLFTNWTAYNFFTNVAERLVRTNLGLTILDYTATNAVQIYPANNGTTNYNSEVHRLLQIAANIYDCTTNVGSAYPYFPSVFRPVFYRSPTNTLKIAGYVQVTNYNSVTNFPYFDPSLVSSNSAIFDAIFPTNTVNSNINFYGVPWVVGAKQGFPNFNEVSVQTDVQVIRRMEVRKTYANSGPGPTNLSQTNLQYVLSITNAIGVEAWNSYATAYPRPLTLAVTNVCSLSVTNELGKIIWPTSGIPLTTNLGATFFINSWPAYNYRVPVTSFKVPFSNMVSFLPPSIYTNGNKASPVKFTPATGFAQYETNNSNLQYFYTPQWGVSISNRLVYVLTDGSNIIDYVNIAGMTASMDANSMLQTTNATDFYLWDTNRVGGATTVNAMTTGMEQQMAVSLGKTPPNPNDWKDYSPQTADVQRSIAAFQKFMGQKFVNSIYSKMQFPPTLYMQLPFTPVHTVSRYVTWQVNDPLVHYSLADLTDFGVPQMTTTGVTNTPYKANQMIPILPNLGRMNDRYNPWGGNPANATQSDLKNGTIVPGHSPTYNVFNSAFMDPGVTNSDAWNFPTNKFPNLGTLGRVHRGTPWQTIYLKATVPSDASWSQYTGNLLSNPTNDWKLVSLFTTSLSDNGGRGLLSVNQTNSAAWAAVLGGIDVISNTTDYSFFSFLTPATYTNLFISPASPQMDTLINGINAYRNTLTNQIPANVFTNMGQILGVPELSVGLNAGNPIGSPFLNLSFVSLSQSNNEIYVPEVEVERIPAQILSLLTLETYPRIVIYSYGQALRPASRSVVPAGVYRGMVTNYEITGETVTRTVLHIEGAPANPRVVIESYNILSED